MYRLKTLFKFFSFFIIFSLVIKLSIAQTPQKIKKIYAWIVYTYTTKNEKVCYALTMPIKALPLNVRHGDNFFLVSNFSKNKDSLEPQFIADYALQKNSKVKVKIAGNNFFFFTDNSSAWLSSDKDEKSLIQWMEKGKEMQIEAVSSRGTHTTYLFSLIGLRSALQAVKECNR